MEAANGEMAERSAQLPAWPHGRVNVSALLWLYAISLGAVALLPQLPEFSNFLSLFLCLSVASLALYGLYRLLAFRVFALRSGTYGLSALIYPLLAVGLGAGWGLWCDWQALQQRLPLAYHGADFPVRLEVISLPGVVTGYFAPQGQPAQPAFNLRFSARVVQSAFAPLRQQKLDLTWYRLSAAQKAKLTAGSQWQMTLRLKRPRGSANPHTFDYEAWLLQRGIYASGYVRDKAPQRWLGTAPGLLSLRQHLRGIIERGDLQHPELLSALLLGDKSGLDQPTRTLLRTTGTAHLLAISGLHVGMVAAFFLMFGQLLGRLLSLIGMIGPCARVSAQRGFNPLWLPAVCALLGALAYTLIAGAPLSAQRALVMTATLLLAWLWRRRLSAGLAYALALAVVLTLQPLAVLNSGFWLSFVAVGALLIGFNGRAQVVRRSEQAVGFPVDSAALPNRIGLAIARLRDWVMVMVRSQWVVVLALLLPSLLFFSGFSLGGLLLNLVAIPWLGLIVLPALLLGIVLAAVGWGSGLLVFADWQLGGLLQFLSLGDQALPTWQAMVPPPMPVLLLAALSVFILLLPRGLPGRGLGWSLLIPLLIAAGLPLSAQRPAQLKVTVLDVGQGLALTVQTPRQRLLYDTGPDSPSGWSSGRQIIAPYLLGEGVRHLDTVVVSHGDRDHAGGLPGLAQSLSLGSVYAPGALAKKLQQRLNISSAPCRAPEAMVLEDLQLTWLWPLGAQHEKNEKLSGEENDHSCVALLQWRQVRLLFTGDISRTVEFELVAHYKNFAPVDLLVAPHHGSRTSSSAALINWAKPANVVFSAGFRHHFGHPHPAVVDRYRGAGSVLFNTAERGALEFTWWPDSRAESRVEPRVVAARDAPRFWYRAH